MGNACRRQQVGHEQWNDGSSLVRGDGRRVGPENSPIVVCEKGFAFHSLIDSGGFGFVFKATRRTTGRTYALKVQVCLRKSISGCVAERFD